MASNEEDDSNDDLIDAATAAIYSYIKAFWHMNHEPKYSNSWYCTLDSYLGMNDSTLISGS